MGQFRVKDTTEVAGFGITCPGFISYHLATLTRDPLGVWSVVRWLCENLTWPEHLYLQSLLRCGWQQRLLPSLKTALPPPSPSPQRHPVSVARQGDVAAHLMILVVLLDVLAPGNQRLILKPRTKSG